MSFDSREPRLFAADRLAQLDRRVLFPSVTETMFPTTLTAIVDAASTLSR